MDAPEDGADGLMGAGTGLVEEVGRRGDHPGLRVGHAGERAARGRIGGAYSQLFIIVGGSTRKNDGESVGSEGGFVPELP